jgi:hypothetical protein
MCLRNRRQFTRTELLVARDHFIRGWPLSRIAARRNCSAYQIRKIVRKIQRLAQLADSERAKGKD